MVKTVVPKYEWAGWSRMFTADSTENWSEIFGLSEPAPPRVPVEAGMPRLVTYGPCRGTIG